MRIQRAEPGPIRFCVNDTDMYLPQQQLGEMYLVWVGTFGTDKGYSARKCIPIYKQWLVKQRIINRKPSRILPLPA